VATKPVSKPVNVEFETKSGEVAFAAHKVVKKPVRVTFRAKNKQR
jgi:hypothetical protein